MIFFCKHNYVENPKLTHSKGFDYSSYERIAKVFICSKCGKKKTILYFGDTIGNLFD